jgi:hypothetical protein
VEILLLVPFVVVILVELGRLVMVQLLARCLASYLYELQRLVETLIDLTESA